MRLCVFVSGRGSNLQAILESELLKGKVRVELVVSDKPECKAFEIAQKHKINYVSVREIEKSGFVTYDQLRARLEKEEIDLIILAGFLKKIPEQMSKRYEGKIINIHPALLPFFGGQGMYGMNVHTAVFNSGMKISGATVHFVNTEYDRGMIIAQKAADISDAASPEEIAEKVLKIEHTLLPEVIHSMADNRVQIVNNRVYIIKNSN